MKTSAIDLQAIGGKLRCITPLSEDEDQFRHVVSSDEESLPHMLNPNYENDYDFHPENDARLSPMTNSVDDDRSAYFRVIEMSSASSNSSRYPQSQAEYQALNTLMSSIPRRHRNSNSFESIVVTDEESDSYIHRKGASKDFVPGYLKPRFFRRSHSPSDSQHSNHALYHSPKRISRETNCAFNSWESSPRPRSRTSSDTRLRLLRKDEQESPTPANPRPPPSPTQSLLTSNTRKQMLHRRSVSLNFSAGEHNRRSSQRDRKLPTGAYSPSSLAKKRRHKAKSATHRRTVSFPDEVAQPHPTRNFSMSRSTKTIHNHRIAMQSDDPALFSLIGATMGGHHGRVYISPDVDPQLMHVSRAVSEDNPYRKGRFQTINQNILIDEDVENQDKIKKANRKSSRRSRSASRSGSRKTSEKAAPDHLHESMHMMKRSEDEEISNTMRDKLSAIMGKKSKINFGRNRTLLDKVDMKNSKRLHNEKLKHSISTTAGRKPEETMESDYFRSTHMESIIEEKVRNRQFSKKMISKRSCIIQ